MTVPKRSFPKIIIAIKQKLKGGKKLRFGKRSFLPPLSFCFMAMMILVLPGAEA